MLIFNILQLLSANLKLYWNFRLCVSPYCSPSHLLYLALSWLNSALIMPQILPESCLLLPVLGKEHLKSGFLESSVPFCLENVGSAREFAMVSFVCIP